MSARACVFKLASGIYAPKSHECVRAMRLRRLQRHVERGQVSLPIATAVSPMRLEKPHSLSYQDITRTNVPSITVVCDRSKVELAGLWLKSVDTSGSSLVARTPFSGPFAALTMAALTFSLVVGFLATNLKSTRDTFGVGTRIEVPSSLPASSGSTSPTAFAAPVVVGIRFMAAARAR